MVIIYSPDTGLQHNKEGTIAATSQPPPGHGVQYENVDPLSQSAVKTTQLYENIPTVSSSHHQNNIEMNQCTAYSILKRTVCFCFRNLTNAWIATS